MRIIAGEFRGRTLFAPEGLETRPTSDRTRESLFNIIRARLPGARVLDLFAGSGALSLEAVSRGAAFAVLCDSSRAAQSVISRNVALCRAEPRVRLVRADWQSAVRGLTEAFDIVFLDPPYRMRDAYGQAVSVLREARLLREDALVVMEYASGETPPALPAPYEIFDTRRYGASSLAFAASKEETR